MLAKVVRPQITESRTAGMKNEVYNCKQWPKDCTNIYYMRVSEKKIEKYPPGAHWGRREDK